MAKTKTKKRSAAKPAKRRRKAAPRKARQGKTAVEVEYIQRRADLAVYQRIEQQLREVRAGQDRVESLVLILQESEKESATKLYAELDRHEQRLMRVVGEVIRQTLAGDMVRNAADRVAQMITASLQTNHAQDALAGRIGEAMYKSAKTFRADMDRRGYWLCDAVRGEIRDTLTESLIAHSYRSLKAARLFGAGDQRRMLRVYDWLSLSATKDPGRPIVLMLRGKVRGSGRQVFVAAGITERTPLRFALRLIVRKLVAQGPRRGRR